MENLGRGVVAVRTSGTDVFVSWRLLGTDPSGVAFNVYRSTGGASAVKLNSSPLTGATIYTDSTADLTQTNAYTVRPVIGGDEQPASAGFTLSADAPQQQYLRVPLQRPAGGTVPGGGTYDYSPGDSSVGDLDGDGEYEIVVKWDPSNQQDNSNGGYTGNVLLDAYKLDGTRLWRIDLGRNIRAGAHYTQYLVYDFDGDGRAELVCKTAPNTRGGDGQFIGASGKFQGTPSAAIDHDADYRNTGGYILTGPEFFTVFDGQTGAELATTNYDIPRNGNPTSSDVTAWGDNYGNRVDRFLAAVAYLDGQRPSIVLCRGYYTRAYLAAWDWRGGQLTKRWVADTGNDGTANPLAAWRGQGAHSLTVGDVDEDGRDEITYGAAAFDDDGTGLYSTGLGHGDALHMSKMDPNRAGLQVWMSHESPSSYRSYGLDLRDARTGIVLGGNAGNGADVGRGAAGDIDPRYLGYELWGSRGGLLSVNGTQISAERPGQMNFMIYWDGDLLRELLDGKTISKWDWITNTASPILDPQGVSSNNGTKAVPCLSADILGDWREEMIVREETNDVLRIYTTTAATTHRLPTLMHDRQYRLAIAWQNVGYNQPPHPGYYIGDGMTMPTLPLNIVTDTASLPAQPPAVVSISRYDPATADTGATAVKFRVTFNVPVSGVDPSDFAVVLGAGMSGSIGGVTTITAFSYDVAVTGIAGTGTVRVDLNASGTGITGPGGVPISGGYTAGANYSRATLAWLLQSTGGTWSNTANWDGGVIPDAVGAVPTFGNFDVLADNSVTLDAPRTVGGLTFGDTSTTTSASWTLTDGGNEANTLTLDTLSGAPTVNVGALGSGATATLDLCLTGTDGFAKAGAGTLVLTKAPAVSGAWSIGAGVLRLTGDANLNTGSSSVSVSGGGQLAIDGVDFSSNLLLTVSGGTLFLSSGSVNLPGGFRTNSDSGSTLRVAGGTLTTPDINIRRNSAGSVDYGSGFIASGGTVSVGTIWLGNNNSNGAMSVEGGTVNATGTITIGNNSNSGRGGGLRVQSGVLNSTDAANGIVLTRASGNASYLTLNGGTTTAEKLTFGLTSGVSAGSGTFALNTGAVLFLGSGGMVKNAGGTYVANITLAGGTIGAKASWSTALPVVLANTPTIRAANAADEPFDITLAGVVSGSGGFIKTGGGTLILSGGSPHAFTGAVDVDGGTLLIATPLSSSPQGIAVHAGGTLAANVNLGRAVEVTGGGTIAPEGAGASTLSASALTLHGGGTMAFDLGAADASDKLAIAGALAKGSAGAYTISVNAVDGFVGGNTYTLASFASTDFVAGDFTVIGLPPGTSPVVTVTATELRLFIRKTPSFTSALQVSGMVGQPLTYTITSDESAATLPVTYAATNLPPGLTFTAPATISGTPTVGGSYHATITATNSVGTRTSHLTFLIGKIGGTNVTVTISAPPAVYDGKPHGATATTSPAGLPVIITYNERMEAPTAPGTYTVEARINDSLYDAYARATLVIAKAPQMLTTEATTREGKLGTPIALEPKSSSGLAITYEVVSGPATITGTTLTFTGAGTVVVRAVQPGDGFYEATEVLFTFNVTAAQPQVFFGQNGVDDFAATIAADGRSGTLLAHIGDEALIVTFSVNPDGTFSTTTTAQTSRSDELADTGPQRSRAVAERTVSGAVRNGVLTWSVAELGTSYTANVENSPMTPSPHAGLFTASLIGSASGTTYVLVAPNGASYALVVTPDGVSSGTGTVNANGEVSVSAGGAPLVTASVDANAATIVGTISVDDAPISIGGLGSTATPTARLVNISSRLRVSSNDAAGASIAGFVVAGDQPKQVLVRAIGPGLVQFGLPSAVAAPALELFDSAGVSIASNTGWGGDAAIAAASEACGAFALPAGSADSALLVTLAPGAYTAQVRSATSGTALLEIYDVAANSSVPTKQLLNISTRGVVGNGVDALIAGFVVAGNEPKRVLIRGVGPGLGRFGVTGLLVNPVLVIANAAQNVVASNDNWGTPVAINASQSPATASEIEALSIAAGAFPLTGGSTDAVVIITLPPGSYTATLTGSEGGTGAALIEVYELPKP